MSTLLTIPDTAELLAHTLTALKSAGYASAAMIPVHKNPSNEGKKTEEQPDETYTAPGRQYADADEALAHLRRFLSNPERNAYNADLDFTFATLAEMLDMLREPLYQHGLLLIQGAQTANKETDPHPYNMVTTFRHVSTKTEVSFTTPMYVKQDRRLDDCQKMGASLTYFKRYGLRDALGITDGDDDADQDEAKRKRIQEKRDAADNIKRREWRETTSDRTKAESISNVLVASGAETNQHVVAEAKRRNPQLTTPDEEAFISVVEVSNFYDVYCWAVLMVDQAKNRGESLPPLGDDPRLYRQIWLEACKKVYSDTLLNSEPTNDDVALPPMPHLTFDNNGFDEISEADAACYLSRLETHRENEQRLAELNARGVDNLTDDELDWRWNYLQDCRIAEARALLTSDIPVDDKFRRCTELLEGSDFRSAREINVVLDALGKQSSPAQNINDDDLPY